MFKEPFPSINCIAISIYDINQRIKLHQNKDIFILDHTDIPQDRCRPHANLQRNIDDLGKIPEKHHNGTGAIAHCQHQHKQAEAVIQNLDRIDRGKISVACRHNQQNPHKKQVDKGCCNKLNNGKHADIKDYLFYQIAVLQKSIGAIGDRLREKEPRDKACRQVQHIRYLHPACHHLASGLKYLIKNNIIHQNSNHRLHQRPQKSQIGACIPLF